MILWGACLSCTCRQGCRVNQPESYRKWFSCPDNPGPTCAAKLLVTSISRIGTWVAWFLSCQLHRHVGPSSDLRTKFWRFEVLCKLALSFFPMAAWGHVDKELCRRAMIATVMFDEGLALRRLSTMPGKVGRRQWTFFTTKFHDLGLDIPPMGNVPSVPAEAAVDTNPMQLSRTNFHKGRPVDEDWRRSNLTFRFSLRSARRCDGMRDRETKKLLSELIISSHNHSSAKMGPSNSSYTMLYRCTSQIQFPRIPRPGCLWEQECSVTVC